MSRFECPKCGKRFKDAAHLRRHVQRKTPCAPIVDAGAAPAGDHTCRYCGRPFATRPSMTRHVKQYCKIANSEDGMDKLFEYTLQQQAREMAAMRTENAQMRDQVSRLAELFEKQLTLTAHAAHGAQGPAPAAAGPAQTTHIGQVGQLIQIMPIIPWDGERRIDVAVSQIAAAFAENARLKEYARMSDQQMTDPALAPPFVTELFVDLVKRGHSDPAARNVYLNPRRADQVLVHMKSGRWEVTPLKQATRMLFDGVAQTIHRVTLSGEERRQLPLEAQNALGLAGLLYDDEPDEYANRARAPMSAHLANTGPPALGPPGS